MQSEVSEYEKQREATIASNLAHLKSLGLEPLVPRRRAPKRKAAPQMETSRRSERARAVQLDSAPSSIAELRDGEPSPQQDVHHALPLLRRQRRGAQEVRLPGGAERLLDSG